MLFHLHLAEYHDFSINSASVLKKKRISARAKIYVQTTQQTISTLSKNICSDKQLSKQYLLCLKIYVQTTLHILFTLFR
jgi:hypothetical protein